VSDDTIIVRPLKPERLDDFLTFFDRDAFADNPDWASCYCQCYYIDHTKEKWSERTGEQNRAQACELARNGAMQGYLAYIDGKPVGGCNAAAWRLVKALHDEPDPLSDKLGEIVCFVVAKPYRARGSRRCYWMRPGGTAPGMEIAEASCGPRRKRWELWPAELVSVGGLHEHRKSDDGGIWMRKPLVCRNRVPATQSPGTGFSFATVHSNMKYAAPTRQSDARGSRPREDPCRTS
jgi:hypothetical protein